MKLLVFLLAFFVVGSCQQDYDIFEAAESGNFNQVEKLLDAGVNPNITLGELEKYKDNDGRVKRYTPLVYALNHKDIVKLLLDRGANVNAKSAMGSNIIKLALISIPNSNDDKAAIIELLLNAGASIRDLNQDLLRDVITSVKPEIIQLLLDNGADCNYWQKKTGFNDKAIWSSLLDYAMSRYEQDECELEIIQILTRCTDDEHIAKAVETLPREGLEANRVMEANRVLVNRIQNIDQSINQYNDRLLHDACTFANYELVKLLIQKGADVNVRGSIRETPLHAACAYSNKPSLNIVKLLCESGADIYAVNRDGSTVFDYLNVDGEKNADERRKILSYLKAKYN